MARNRLAEINAPFTVCFFDGAMAHAACAVGREHAVASFDNAGDKVAFAVDIAYSVFLYLAAGGRQKVIPYFRQYLFDFFNFSLGDRSAGIAFYAALSEAFVEIAAEKALDKVKADKGVLYL